MRKSTNGGMSFTFAPVVIKSEISEPEGIISFQKAHSWPYVAVNPEDGSLNMVYGSGTNVLYSYSTDKGVTWSTSSNKGMNLPGSSTWNPNITCNSKGKLSIVYYSSGYKVLVATGYANDETFTIWSQGSFNFSTPFKYTDYIGIACNDFTYWAVWHAPSGTKSKIFGTHRTVSPVVENLDQDYLTFTNDKIKFDGIAYNSPYTPSNALFPGVVHTLQTYSNTLTKNGSTYNFYRWEDENGNLISTNSQVDVKIDNHRYRAMFAYVPPPPIQYVTVNIKNEFKDPNNTIHNGGTVNIDNEDYENTENLPGQQVTETYLKNSVHRFEAKEQIYPEGSYYRGFNPRSDYDGGWVYPDLITRRYESTIQPTVTNNNGTYLAKYRNRYNAYVNGSAPEDNGFVANIFPTKQIWQFESSQISAPTDQTFPSGLTGIFVNWLDGSQINPIIVIPTDNQTYTALYKYPHHSNSTSAYSSNSQRKFIQTPDGVKHICYESMGKVWYELSTDNGTTWFLGNAGKPLSSVDSKNPSMSFYGNQVGIVWQEKDGNSFKIKMALFWMSDYSSSLFGTIAEDYGAYSLNANPVFAWGNNGKTVVVWSGNDLCVNPFGSTALKYWYGSASSNGINLIQQCGISGTDENSTNPTIIADYTDNISNPFNYHLAWEQLINTSNSKVNYCRLFYQNNNLQQSAVEEASLNSGYNKNYKPLITLRKAFGSEYVYISWIGYRQFTSQGAGLEKTNFEQTGETRALVRNKLGANWSAIGVYGNSVASQSLNKGTTVISRQQIMGFAWSEYNGVSFVNKMMKFPASQNIFILSTTGKDIQINNSVSFSDMFANSYQTVSTPFSFNLSQNFNSLNKENSLMVYNGREGIVGRSGGQFYFALGDITVNGNTVNFPQIPDSITISTLSELNKYLTSEPFAVDNNSSLVYGVQYGITDTLACISALEDEREINFKVELYDPISNEILGVFDNVTFNENNVIQYENIGYQVDLTGIGNRTLKLRLVVDYSPDFSFNLSDRYADESILAKNNLRTINYKGSLAVTEFVLEQNYPNPFNPTTVISWQSPVGGHQTLKIYDILGNEVATLIDEYREAGRYKLEYDASNLASGVYIYRIAIHSDKLTTGNYVSSKKMMVIK